MEVKRVRKKDAERVVAGIEAGEWITVLGNGKVPNVMGPGLILIGRDLDGGLFYAISDTHLESGVWVARGGERRGEVSREEAVNLLAEYGRAASQVRGMEWG